MSALSNLEEQLKEERGKVDVSAISFSTREIVRMFEARELIIDPSYQRKYRWNDESSSKFIESIFLGLPIPPIFVATNDDFTWEVVDGVQRISTIIWYMTDNDKSLKKIGKENNLKLKDLKALGSLNGNSYLDLPKSIQLYFSRRALQVISLTDKSDKDIRFELFNRINTGSVSLSEQEIRTAVYRGDFIDMIEDLAGNADMNSMLKLQKKRQNDGTTAEQVLKFFAYKNYRNNFRGSVRDFLNKYAEKVTNGEVDFDYKAESELFRKSASYLNKILKGKKFVSETGNSVTPMIRFEACLIAIGEIISSGGNLVESLEPGWMEDKNFVKYTTGATNTAAMLRGRIERAKEIFSLDVQ